MLKQLSRYAYLELGLGTIELNAFAYSRVRYSHRTTLPSWVMCRLIESGGGEDLWIEQEQRHRYTDSIMDREALGNAMRVQCLSAQGLGFVKKRFDLLIKEGRLSPTTNFQALPEFTWRVVIAGGEKHT
jgi:hypothetical protein